MLASLDLDPRMVPASNVVFVRSSTEATLETNKELLLQACWPVHQAVIDALRIRVVVCFGGTAGRWIRERLAAERLVDSFQEKNRRGWRSEVHATRDNRLVLTLSHPGRADWRNPDADPTCLVRRALAKFRH
jgi:uracil-DNA glycosylase